MFVIDVHVNQEKATEQQLQAHRAYCHEEFEKGHFVMCGPSATHDGRGIIIASVEGLSALRAILARDPLRDAATYDVHEFRASMIARDIHGR